MLTHYDVDPLLAQLRALRERLGDARGEGPPHWVGEDLRDLALEALGIVRPHLRIGDLDAFLSEDATRDLAALRAAADALRLPDTSYTQQPGDIPPQTRLADLDALIAGLGDMQALDEIEVQLRLNLVGDAKFDGLLRMLHEDQVVARRAIQDAVRSKLDLLDDDAARGLWQAMLKESREGGSEDEERPAYDRRDAPASFFAEPTDESEIRDRIAQYVAEVRPRLERQALERGHRLFPAGTSRIATMLSWTRPQSGRPLTPPENRLVRCLSRIAVCWSTFVQRDRDPLRSAIGVGQPSYIIDGRGYRSAERGNPLRGDRKQTLLPEHMAYELEAVLRLARTIAGGSTSVERALWCFKLGMEVAKSRSTFDARELDLQRDLVRFLVERDIPAIGVQFADGEIDLWLEDERGPLVVEEKRYTEPPTESDLRNNVSQLKTYMSRVPAAPRGVLVLFNQSDAVITAPRTFLRDAIYILAVNLGSRASDQKHFVDIAASAHAEQWIDVRSSRNGRSRSR